MTRVAILVLAGLALMVEVASAAGPIQAPVQGPSAVAGKVPVCSDRNISYKHHHPRKEPCGARVEAVLLVKDPCDCCFVEVPVCLPCGCQGAPEVCSRK